jgi:hypothetical protein
MVGGAEKRGDELHWSSEGRASETLRSYVYKLQLLGLPGITLRNWLQYLEPPHRRRRVQSVTVKNCSVPTPTSAK